MPQSQAMTAFCQALERAGDEMEEAWTTLQKTRAALDDAGDEARSGWLCSSACNPDHVLRLPVSAALQRRGCALLTVTFWCAAVDHHAAG